MARPAPRAIALLALLSLCAFSSAQLDVKISPSQAGGGSFYPLEVRTFTLTVANLSDSRAENVQVDLGSPENRLSFLIGGRENGSRRYTFVRILPGHTEERNFDIKAVSSDAGFAEIRADYSAGDDAGAAFYSAEILAGGLLVDAYQPVPAEGGQASMLEFTLTNNSEEAAALITAEVSLGGGPAGGVPFTLDSLGAGESVQGSIAFTPEPGGGVLVFTVFFDDSLGTHALQRQFVLESQSRGFVALVLVALVVLIVAVHFARRGLFGGGDGHESKEDGGLHGKWEHK